jgi:CTP:molybdopterin cytidylyltransferase MocA
MGSPKALLPWRGSTLLASAIRALDEVHVEHIVVVLGLHHEAIKAMVPELADTRVVLNLDETSGRSGSIRIGSAAVADEVTHVLVQSVDQPCSADVLRALYTSPAAIAMPTYEGRRGHPVCFAGHLLAELRTVSEQQQGLRAIVRRHADRIAEVPVDDPAVTWNLNDPQAYAAAVSQSI